MTKYLIFISSLICTSAHAETTPPFSATCTEGETHRYDGNNGLTMSGDKMKDPLKGWITEKWGGIDIVWNGGNTIKVGDLDARVFSADNNVISAVSASDNGIAINIYTIIIDLTLGEATYSQSHASTFGKTRSIKVRSQDLKCSIINS